MVSLIALSFVYLCRYTKKKTTLAFFRFIHSLSDTLLFILYSLVTVEYYKGRFAVIYIYNFNDRKHTPLSIIHSLLHSFDTEKNRIFYIFFFLFLHGEKFFFVLVLSIFFFFCLTWCCSYNTRDFCCVHVSGF